jgi:hypothetical protein
MVGHVVRFLELWVSSNVIQGILATGTARPEDGDITLYRNVGTYLLVDTR